MQVIIPDYSPSPFYNAEEVTVKLGAELRRMRGCRLCDVHALWCVEEEAWESCAPIILELDAFNFEVMNGNLHELFLTINGINLNGDVRKTEDSSNRAAYVWRTEWQALSPYIGAFVSGLDLLEYRTSNWILHGIGLETTKGYFSITNGLDCNQITSGRTTHHDLRRVVVF